MEYMWWIVDLKAYVIIYANMCIAQNMRPKWNEISIVPLWQFETLYQGKRVSFAQNIIFMLC